MFFKTKKITALLVLSLIINMLWLPGFSVMADDGWKADYEPINPSAIFENYNDGSAKAAIRLSWINPTAGDLQKISIYGDEIYGEDKFDTLISTIDNPVPGEMMDYVDRGTDNAGLTHGQFYTYRIVYEFSDRQTEVLLSRQATKNYNEFVLRQSGNGSSKVYVNGSMANMPGYSQKIVNDDGGYLQMSANVLERSDVSDVSWLKFHIGSGKLSAGSYKVKFTYKSDSDFTWGAINFAKSSDWTTVEEEISTTNGDITVESYNIKQSFKNLCIKSVEVYSLSDELVDSYDCSVYTVKPQPVGSIDIMANGSDVEFSIATSPSWWWNNGGDGNAHVVNFYNIYEVINGERFLRATLSRPEMSKTKIPVTLHNVPVGKHVYEITCSDLVGLESEPVETSVEIADIHDLSNLSAKPYRISSYAVGMDVSWTNPSSEALSKVALYRVDNDGDDLLAEYDSPAVGETVTFKDANLETNNTYSYKVVCSFADHNDVEGTMSGYLDLEVKELVVSYHPKNMTAVQYGTSSGKVGITLSWINPTVTEISSVSVYRMENGNEVFLSDDFDLSPEKVVEYNDLDLNAGEFYTYKIKFDFPDRLSGVYYTSAVANDTEFRRLIRGINVAALYSKTKIVPGVTNKVVKDGDNSCMKITVNVPEGDGERGAYLSMNSPIPMEVGGKYTFKMRVKTEENTTLSFACGSLSGVVGTQRVPADGNWHDISVDFTASYKTGTVIVAFEGTISGLMIDDLEISNADGVLDYFNFDEYDVIPAPPGILEVTPQGNSATATMSISKDWWWSAETGFDKIARTINYYNVYEKTESGMVLRAKLPRPIIQVKSLSAVIDDLMYNSEYTFYATTEDSYGVLESDTIETKFKTDAEPSGIKISDFEVRSSENAADGTVKSGNCSVSVNIGNYADSGLKAQLIVAVYKANKMIKLYGTDIKDVPSSLGNKPISHLKVDNIDTTGITGDNCTMEVMLWSGVDTMKILKGVQTFKIINN